MARGPITERLIRAARRAQSAQVVDLAAFRAGGQVAPAPGDTCECVVPAGHPGTPGELWLARVLPAPRDGLPGLVFTTPYVLLSPASAWEDYLGRTLAKLDPKHPSRAYPARMKHGLSQRYWPEYVFEAYAGHRPEAVFLLGLPDVDGSRPHGAGFVGRGGSER